METIKIDVTEGRNTKEVRASDAVPIVYYGKGVLNRHFSASYQEFRKAYQKAGRSMILYFVSENGDEIPVLVQAIQFDPVSGRIIHADVIAVNLKEVIRTLIPLVFVGVSPAVKDMSGVLVHNKESVEVECLPTDLIHEIEVDISSLVDFHSSITVGDLKVPSTLKILDAPGINVATVSATREEKDTPHVVAPVVEAAVAAAPAGGEKPKKSEKN